MKQYKAENILTMPKHSKLLRNRINGIVTKTPNSKLLANNADRAIKKSARQEAKRRIAIELMEVEPQTI